MTTHISLVRHGAAGRRTVRGHDGGTNGAVGRVERGAVRARGPDAVRAGGRPARRAGPGRAALCRVPLARAAGRERRRPVGGALRPCAGQAQDGQRPGLGATGGTPQSWLSGTAGCGTPQSWLPGRGLAGGTPQSWFSSPSVTLVARSAAAPAATSVRLSEPAPVAVA